MKGNVENCPIRVARVKAMGNSKSKFPYSEQQKSRLSLYYWSAVKAHSLLGRSSVAGASNLCPNSCMPLGDKLE